MLPLRPYFEELLAITTRLVQAPGWSGSFSGLEGISSFTALLPPPLPNPDDQPGLLAPQSDLAEFRYRTRNFLEEVGGREGLVRVCEIAHPPTPLLFP